MAEIFLRVVNFSEVKLKVSLLTLTTVTVQPIEVKNSGNTVGCSPSVGVAKSTRSFINFISFSVNSVPIIHDIAVGKRILCLVRFINKVPKLDFTLRNIVNYNAGANAALLEGGRNNFCSAAYEPRATVALFAKKLYKTFGVVGKNTFVIFVQVLVG